MVTAQDITIDALRATGAKPHFFGLGFIQLKVSDAERIHFYHPDLTANVPEEELHDHRYGFESTVLQGQLKNEIWTFTPDPDGDHEMAKVSCDPKNPIPAADLVPVTGRTHIGLSFTTPAGAAYHIADDQFHRVFSKSCITLLRREETTKPFARVIRPLGQAPVCPFSVSMSESQCWELISDMLRAPVTFPLDETSPGYHLRPFRKGVLGEASKVFEEAEELMDAVAQGVSVMALIELSDMVGAMESYLETHHPSLTLADLKKMSDVTRRAFRNGHRS